MRTYSGETREDLKALAGVIRGELIRESLVSMGRTAPNPAVACVVAVRNGKTYRLFTGGTEPPGGRHAEIVALDHLDAAMWSLGDSRMYVTLEPCSTHGRTPPCTRRITGYDDLGRVTIASGDPNLGGEGVRELRENGKRVRSGNSDVGETFLQGFFSRLAGHGPRLHLKAAITADGYMSGGPDERLLISGPAARDFTMQLRACLDAVLVGPGTLAGDSPGLDLRLTADGPITGERVQALEGGDLLCESMLRFFEDEANRRSKTDPEFQPRRLFLAGRDFPARREFLSKQIALAQTTKRPAEILLGAFSGPEFTGDTGFGGEEGILMRDHRRELPRLDAPDFGRSLRRLLGELDLNEVLLEGGPTMLAAMEPALLPGDRVYILKSRKMVLDRPGAPARHNSGGRKVPSYLLEPPFKARFDLGEDELILKEF